MKNKIKFVYFDIGNVFMTFDKIFTRAASDLNIDQNLIDVAEEPYDVDANLGKIDIPEVWQKVCKELKIKDGEKYPIIESWVSDYDAIKPMHELAKMIAKKYKVGILSNYYRDYFEEATKQGFIPKIKFDEVIVSAEVGCMKPEPEIYKIAEEWSGYSGEEILFIDDKKENLFTAAKFGWQTFLMDYKNPQKSCEEIGKILLL
ncbi:MAG: HAD family phosphatase [bacterium]|nr:HAD family phosphatase [bacterium]